MLVQVTVISFKQVTASSLFTPQITMYSLTFLLDNVRFYSIFIVSAIIGSIFIKRWRNFYSNKFLTYFKNELWLVKRGLQGFPWIFDVI